MEIFHLKIQLANLHNIHASKPTFLELCKWNHWELLSAEKAESGLHDTLANKCEMRYSDPDVRTFWSDLRVNSPLQFDHKLYDSTKREQSPQILGHQRASTSMVSLLPKETSQRTIRLLCALRGISVDNWTWVDLCIISMPCNCMSKLSILMVRFESTQKKHVGIMLEVQALA